MLNELTPEQLRRVDKLLSEQVMNHDVFSIGGAPLQEGRKNPDGSVNGTRNPAHYSTSIEAAFELVEKIKMFGEGLLYLERGDDDNGWRICEHDYSDFEVIVRAPTLPLAITSAIIEAEGLTDKVKGITKKQKGEV